MKVVKQSPPFKPSKSASVSSSKSTHKLSQQNTISSQTRVRGKMKENLDSKTSTQDGTHKLDTSRPRLKDLSNVIPESILCDEMLSENNLSAVSLINMLDEGNLKQSTQV